jgi:hypothetical protein
MTYRLIIAEADVYLDLDFSFLEKSKSCIQENRYRVPVNVQVDIRGVDWFNHTFNFICRRQSGSSVLEPRWSCDLESPYEQNIAFYVQFWEALGQKIPSADEWPDNFASLFPTLSGWWELEEKVIQYCTWIEHTDFDEDKIEASYDAVCFDLWGTLIAKPPPPMVPPGLEVAQWLRAGFLDKLLTKNVPISDLLTELGVDLRSVSVDLDPPESEYPQLHSEVLDVLDMLNVRNKKVAVCANASFAQAESINIPWILNFDYCAFSCQMGLKKPDPFFYDQISNRLQVPLNRILFVSTNRTYTEIERRYLGLNSQHLDRQANGNLMRFFDFY